MLLGVRGHWQLFGDQGETPLPAKQEAAGARTEGVARIENTNRFLSNKWLLPYRPRIGERSPGVREREQGKLRSRFAAPASSTCSSGLLAKLNLDNERMVVDRMAGAGERTDQSTGFQNTLPAQDLL